MSLRSAFTSTPGNGVLAVCRAMPTTLWPRSTKRSDKASPMPLLAPVMRNVRDTHLSVPLSSMRNMILFIAPSLVRERPACLFGPSRHDH